MASHRPEELRAAVRVLKEAVRQAMAQIDEETEMLDEPMVHEPAPSGHTVFDFDEDADEPAPRRPRTVFDFDLGEDEYAPGGPRAVFDFEADERLAA
jgi:hypothetical protein